MIVFSYNLLYKGMKFGSRFLNKPSSLPGKTMHCMAPASHLSNPSEFFNRERKKLPVQLNLKLLSEFAFLIVYSKFLITRLKLLVFSRYACRQDKICFYKTLFCQSKTLFSHVLTKRNCVLSINLSITLIFTFVTKNFA